MDARRLLNLAFLSLALPASASASPPDQGALALARANRAALEASRLDRFEGGRQVFDYRPGRLYEVWTAPMRVTILSLGKDEEVVSIAAGDTVRWQIGETRSGEGMDLRRHVLIKPFERGLSTNLVLTTSRRVYLILLRSGPEASFNAAVAWKPDPAPLPAPAPQAPPPPPTPPSMLDAAFSILPQGRRPSWTPTTVLTDGARTYIAFPAALGAGPAPILSLLGSDGAGALANYRQRGAMFIVDGVIDVAELRLGGARRPQVVRIVRQPEARR